MATSTIGLTTEIGLSEIDEMIGQGPTTSHFKVALFGGNFWGVNYLHVKKLIARGDFPTRTKYYLSQSTKTLLKDFFVLNPPTVLDPGRTTTSLSAN